MFKQNYKQYKSSITDFSQSPSMVQPQFSEEADINNIMQKYAKTGVLPTPNRMAQYLDVSEGYDYSLLQDKLLNMNQMFSELPSQVRQELRTPQEFYEAFQSPLGLAKLEALGIISKKEPAQAAPVAESEAQSQVSSGAPK